MDCSLPGSSVRGILQARILEWLAMLSSRGIFLTQGWNLSLLWLLHAGRFFMLSHQGNPVAPLLMGKVLPAVRGTLVKKVTDMASGLIWWSGSLLKARSSNL